MNQPNFKTREEFEQYADEHDMITGKYNEASSKFHKEGDKMWMARPEDAPNRTVPGLGWFYTIPSIEGVFSREDGNHDGFHNSVQGSASYNYGNNLITHLWLDIVPWKVMDCLF